MGVLIKCQVRVEVNCSSVSFSFLVKGDYFWNSLYDHEMGSFPKNNKKIEAWGNSVMDYWTHHISILATELKPAGCGGYAM